MPLGLNHRERQHRDRHSLMHKRQRHRNLMQQDLDTERRLQHDRPEQP
jgi:hypothetical protein